ncbi:MAG: leucyl aminopeptidase [Alphaproteobacteria bacterium]|nr:leucyl aminopeptidase [Bartonella sp. TP]MDN5249578.1 leucyl aminopeptidase [Alphaproteobacteria bacterium]WJW80552.1 leucyl aminopeptidase [Bartonella sp. TP]
MAVHSAQNEGLEIIYTLFGKAFVKNFYTSSDFKAAAFSHIETTVPYYKNVAKLAFIGTGEGTNLPGDGYVKLGSIAAKLLKTREESFIFFDNKNVETLIDFLVGAALGAYRFDKYFVAKSKKDKQPMGQKITLVVSDMLSSEAINTVLFKAKATAESVILARDLGNEPANILTTTEFKTRIENLSGKGLKIEILEQKQLQELGMNALLAVAQGSKNPPYMAIMRWSGAAEAKTAPLVFVGKGVVFDSGGISLKPAANMEAMKGDMCGAAAVAGVMQLLAMCKSKINAIGIIGLVENMPGAEAMRPGDIVTSMSGQTIEIVNTDAEGRLVLADLLYYAKENFAPSAIINLATLTGAILVALGKNYAGLFSNDDNLGGQLLEAGKESGEKLWQMPLHEEYDEMLDSKFADMLNSPGRYGASITAAQFLKRFVAETPWAHLDIVGTAFDAKRYSYGSSWATGFGVRLLDRFAQKYYE